VREVSAIVAMGWMEEVPALFHRNRPRHVTFQIGARLHSSCPGW